MLRNQFSGDSFPVVWLLTAGVDRFPNNDSSLVGLAIVHVAYILSGNVRNFHIHGNGHANWPVVLVVAAVCISPNVDDRHPSGRKHDRIDIGYHHCSDR